MKSKIIVRGGTRTHNPHLRRVMRYPLRYTDSTIYFTILTTWEKVFLWVRFLNLGFLREDLKVKIVLYKGKIV